MQEFYDAQKRKYPEDKVHRFLALGLSKGTVIFLAIDQLDTIYARFSFHRQAIQTIHQIHGTQNFITICEEMNIVVWGFKDFRQYIISANQMFRPISCISSFNKNIFMAFSTFDLQLFQFNEQLNDLMCIKV